MKTMIEYRVRPVTRYIVTRHERQQSDCGTMSTNGQTVEKGEYPNVDMAHEVAYALCKDEHQRLGWPTEDERIQYPQNSGGTISPRDLSEALPSTDPRADGRTTRVGPPFFAAAIVDGQYVDPSDVLTARNPRR